MSIETIQEDLSGAMKEVTSAKISISKLEGQEFEILRQMKDKLDLNSPEEAKKEIKRIDLLLAKAEKEIEADYKEIKTKYDW